MPLDAKPAAIVMRSDPGSSDTIAKCLASDGYNVVIPFYRNSAAVNRTVSEIEERGGTAVALFANIENAAHVDAVLRTTILVFGRCDIIVNTAERLPTPASPESPTYASRSLHWSDRSQPETRDAHASAVQSVREDVFFGGSGQEPRGL